MKLLDKAINKAVLLSKPVQELADHVKSLAVNVEKLASHLAIIAHNQVVHHYMIQQMNAVQQIIYKKLSENSLDTSLPELKLEDISDEIATTAAKQAARSKPN